MASSKTLSTTTLNLRFMQNALRSQAEKVELPKAPVKDDGEWEVSQAVRDAWGLNKSSASREPDVHEDSYLSFMFQKDDDEEPTTSSKGRRTFGKNGKEVTKEEEKLSDEATLEEQQAIDEAMGSESTEQKGRRKVHPRPVTLSGDKTGGGGGFLRGFDQIEKLKTNPNNKTAKQMIFESGNVGSDMRASTSKSSSNKPAADSGAASPQFMKPAGVDEPSMTAREPKPKRKRDTATVETSRERPKKTKKTKQNAT